jgi:hypothetical protein
LRFKNIVVRLGFGNIEGPHPAVRGIANDETHPHRIGRQGNGQAERGAVRRKNGHVEVGVNNYRETSWKIAQEEGHVDFVDVSALVAEQYEKLGPEKTFGMFHTKEQVHLDIPGAFLNARCTVAGLKGLPDAPVSKYLSYLGLMVEAEAPPAVPGAWPKDLTHVTPVAPKSPAAK